MRQRIDGIIETGQRQPPQVSPARTCTPIKIQ
jgi:hypothetical protein